MKLPSLLHMTAPLREDFDIPYHSIGDPQAPPALALVGGVHGNELNGVFVLSRLADYLHQIQGGRYAGRSLNGRVLIVPAVNVLGLNMRMRLWPFDKTDLNRMFPGYGGGETTQRIAAAVLEATRNAACRIDLHSSNLDLEETPHVRIYEPNGEERAGASQFGFGVVYEKKLDPHLSVSLIRAWKDCGGLNFVLRGGQAGTLQLPHCERLFAAIVRFLHERGILEDRERPLADENMLYFKPEQAFRVLSEQAGFFVSHLDVGQWLQAGDLLGILYDGYTGKIRGEIHAPVAGLLMGLRRQPLTFEGDLMAKLLRRSSS